MINDLMEKNIKKIIAALEASPMSQERQAEFAMILSRAEDEVLEEVAELLEADPAWAEKIWGNFVQKKNAFLRDDADAFERIIGDEVAQLADLDMATQ